MFIKKDIARWNACLFLRVKMVLLMSWENVPKIPIFTLLDTRFKFVQISTGHCFHVCPPPQQALVFDTLWTHFTKTLFIFTCAALMSLKLNSSIRARQLAFCPTEHHKLRNDYLGRLHNYTRWKCWQPGDTYFPRVERKFNESATNILLRMIVCT